MSHRLTLLLFLLLAFIVIPACKKDDKPTIIKGRITDQKTGEPIEGAIIDIGANTSNSIGQSIESHIYSKSNNNGDFTSTLEGRFANSQINKTGYVTQKNGIRGINNGEENTIEIKLAPRDGILRLEIQNVTGLHDSIYASIYSKTEDIEAHGFYGGTIITDYPLILGQGGTFTQVFNLASPEMIEIRGHYNKPTYQIPYTFRDSIMVVPNDTATYILSY